MLNFFVQISVYIPLAEELALFFLSVTILIVAIIIGVGNIN